MVSCQEGRSIPAAAISCSAWRCPPTNTRYRAEGDFRDGSGEVVPDDSDNDDPTPLDGHKFDSEVVVVVDMQVAFTDGSNFFTRGATHELMQRQENGGCIE